MVEKVDDPESRGATEIWQSMTKTTPTTKASRTARGSGGNPPANTDPVEAEMTQTEMHNIPMGRDKDGNRGIGE